MDIEEATFTQDTNEKISSDESDNKEGRTPSTANSSTERKPVNEEQPVHEIAVDQSAVLNCDGSSAETKFKMTEKITLPKKLNAEKVNTTGKSDNHDPIFMKPTPVEEEKSTCAEEDDQECNSEDESESEDGSSFSDDGSYNDDASCSDEELNDDDDDSDSGDITGNEQVSSKKVTRPRNDEKKQKACEKSSNEQPKATEGAMTSCECCSSETQSENDEKYSAIPKKKDSTEKRDVAERKLTYAEITSAKCRCVGHETKMIEIKPTENKPVNDGKFSNENTEHFHRISMDKSKLRESASIQENAFPFSENEISTSSEKGAYASSGTWASTSSGTGASTSSGTGASIFSGSGASISSKKMASTPSEKLVSNPSKNVASTSSEKNISNFSKENASTFSKGNASTSINKIESSSRKKRSSNSSKKESACDRPSGDHLPSLLPRPPCHDGKPGPFCRELMAINESQVWMDQKQQLFEVMLPEYQKLHASLVEGFVRTAHCQELRNTAGCEFTRLIVALRANINSFMIKPLEKFTLEYAIKVQGLHDRKNEATIEAEIAAANSSHPFVLPEIKCKNIKGVNKDVTLELSTTFDDDACLKDLLQDALADESEAQEMNSHLELSSDGYDNEFEQIKDLPKIFLSDGREDYPEPGVILIQKEGKHLEREFYIY